MRSNYWSCSEFADWIRGTTYPEFETGPGWKAIKELAKTNHPLRYWIADNALDTAQNIIMFIPDKLYNVKYYINNRWVTKTHALTAHSRDIKPGDWCDVGYRFLPCLFNQLVDFVETELAQNHVRWNESESQKYNAPSSWLFSRTREWRCKQAGLGYLDWARSLTYDPSWGVEEDDENYGKLTPQAIAAQEVLDLYTWWTVEYPNRSEPMEESGLSAYYDRMRENHGDILAHDETEEERAEAKPLRDLSAEIEEFHETQDEEMMIRLIKVRNYLWT